MLKQFKLKKYRIKEELVENSRHVFFIQERHFLWWIYVKYETLCYMDAAAKYCCYPSAIHYNALGASAACFNSIEVAKATLEHYKKRKTFMDKKHYYYD